VPLGLPEMISFTVPLPVWIGTIILGLVLGAVFRIRSDLKRPGLIWYRVPEGTKKIDASEVVLAQRTISWLGVAVYRDKGVRGPKGATLSPGDFVFIKYNSGKEPDVDIVKGVDMEVTGVAL